MKTKNQRRRSGLTRGEILVLIDEMEHYSGHDPNTLQITRLKESFKDMTDKNRAAKDRKESLEVHSKKELVI
jgi:hypothetical protein